MIIRLNTTIDMAIELHALAVIRRAELAARCKEIQRCAEMPMTAPKRRKELLDDLRKETNTLNEWKLVVLSVESTIAQQQSKGQEE